MYLYLWICFLLVFLCNTISIYVFVCVSACLCGLHSSFWMLKDQSDSTFDTPCGTDEVWVGGARTGAAGILSGVCKWRYTSSRLALGCRHQLPAERSGTANFVFLPFLFFPFFPLSFEHFFIFFLSLFYCVFLFLLFPLMFKFFLFIIFFFMFLSLFPVFFYFFTSLFLFLPLYPLPRRTPKPHVGAG